MPIRSLFMSLTRNALVLTVLAVVTTTAAACARPVPDGIHAQSGTGQPTESRSGESRPADDEWPTRIAIDHDNHHARHVGHAPTDGAASPA